MIQKVQDDTLKNKLTCRGRIGAFSALHRAGEAENELKQLLPDPDKVLSVGHLLGGRGNNCTSALVTLDRKQYVLKKYYYRGWYYGFRHIFRRSRAYRNWLAANTMRERGVQTPRPVLCLEERSCFFLKRSYILFEFLQGVKTLTNEWQVLEPGEREEFMTRLGSDLGYMHRAGCIHGDTNWDNILVDRRGHEPAFSWVDLDCSRIMRRLHPARASKDIKHVLRDLDRLSPGDRALQAAFLSAWSHETGISFE